MRLLLCIALLTLAVSGYRPRDHRPLVATKEGRVRGVADRSAGGNLFFSFKGIPYAEPPVRKLRFREPQRHALWTGVRDASRHGSECPNFDQLRNNTRVGDEDCLFVNVFTRQLPGEEYSLAGLPVMVYIHGGGFFFGSGDADEYGPHYLMDEPVVLVTFNYRLGPFGFFTTHDAAAPGNYGMLDQVLLLQWVQDNIAALRTLAVVLSDRFYVNEITEEIRLASAHAPLYKYVLDHTGPGRLSFDVDLPVPSNLRWPAPELGVSHGDDLRYLFSTDSLPRERPGSPGYAIIRFMVNLWTNFARTGRPSSDVLPMPDWPIFTEHSQRHMRLNSQPALGERLFEERVNFWQTVAVNEQWRHPVIMTPDGC
ncbi:Esterase FE4 [Amphibalanus amphitrite]|uniref:Esterase FE4 n=1 Tax=Amphibalanus amphitrite TaxID=1232801 RepID=A0A6A4VAB2_AMPAM|nr:Esterase FE4 [Amphibalanus amphitrite]